MQEQQNGEKSEQICGSPLTPSNVNCEVVRSHTKFKMLMCAEMYLARSEFSEAFKVLREDLMGLDFSYHVFRVSEIRAVQRVVTEVIAERQKEGKGTQCYEAFGGIVYYDTLQRLFSSLIEASKGNTCRRFIAHGGVAAGGLFAVFGAFWLGGLFCFL